MNLRIVKKDIDFLTDEFLSDALISLSFANEDAKRESIMAVINEAIDLRRDTYTKINHPAKENIKAYFRQTTDEFLAALDVLFDKLSAAVNAKKEEEPAAAKKPAAKKPAAKKAPAKKAPAKKAEAAE